MAVWTPLVYGEVPNIRDRYPTDMESMLRFLPISQGISGVGFSDCQTDVIILTRTDSSMHCYDIGCSRLSGNTDFVKCESDQNYNSEKRAGNEGDFEVSRAGGATGRGVRQIEQRILELRLRWALRRIQQRMVYSFQRRCEMRLFVVLRLQYLYRRRRSRIRAAVTIQRFIRPILHKPLVRHRH